jgi:hypothetical protein
MNCSHKANDLTIVCLKLGPKVSKTRTENAPFSGCDEVKKRTEIRNCNSAKVDDPAEALTFNLGVAQLAGFPCCVAWTQTCKPCHVGC